MLVSQFYKILLIRCACFRAGFAVLLIALALPGSGHTVLIAYGFYLVPPTGPEDMSHVALEVVVEPCNDSILFAQPFRR